MNQIRQAVWSVDANLPLAERLHDELIYYKDSMARASFTLVMLGIAGAMALHPRHCRPLRCDRLFGFAAHSRNRHSSGPRRSAKRRDETGSKRGSCGDSGWTRGWFGRISGLYQISVELAIRRECNRPAHLCWRHHPARARRVRRLLHPCAPSRAHQSDGGAQI